MELPELDMAYLDRELDRTKAATFLNKSAAFLGPLMCSLEFLWDDTQPTAWTDGVRVGWNPYFFLSLSREARKTVLMHELWHPGYMHLLRVDNRDHEMWNIACDHVINLQLEEEGFSFEGIEWCYKDPQFRGMASEEIYDYLMQNPPPPPPAGGGGSFGKGDGGDMKPMSKGDTQKALDNIVTAAHAARAAKQAGAIPGELQEVLDKFLKPKVDWRIVLRRFFTQWELTSWTWRRPNRRYQDMYLPSKGGSNRIECLNYYLDVSGSVTDSQVIRFNSEVKFIKDVLKPKKLVLIQFDTRITSITEFGENDPFEKLVVVGRGGTDLRPVRQHILDTKPTAAVVFSDLYVTPMEPVNTPIIWVAIANKSAQVTCGQLIRIQD